MDKDQENSEQPTDRPEDPKTESDQTEAVGHHDELLQPPKSQTDVTVIENNPVEEESVTTPLGGKHVSAANLTKIQMYLFMVLALLAGAIVGFFAFWYTAGPKNDAAKPSPTVEPTQTPEPTRTASSSATPNPPHSENITVTAPALNSTITSPLTVSGKARVFENAVSVRLKNVGGTVIAQQQTSAIGEIGQLNDFSVQLSFPKQTLGTQGIVEVYTQSAEDGSEEDLVSIPIYF